MASRIRPATPADAARLAAVHVRSWRETYAGLMPDTFLDAMTGEDRRARRERTWADTPERGPDVVQLAELGGQVVAFASAGAVRPHTAIPGGYHFPQDYDAELYTLYALREAHGHGLGRALLRAVWAALQERGFSGVALWVLTANPTSDFYRHLGARELGEQTLEIPGGQLTETALGWPRLDSLG